jgi:uncharacterized protein YcbK (DUF882 family)
MPDDVAENIQRLAENLQVLRDFLNAPIKITSGYRSPEHNNKIGGAPNSQHMRGTASDFKVRGYQPEDVARTIEHLIADGKMEEGGLGVYPSWVHYDVRGSRARW